MTQSLSDAIEGLYKTFSVYPFQSVMDGCPCCVSNADKEQIHSKPLRKLDGDDLSRYAFKAMTTWGNETDFKHYLPRIFEITATTSFVVDTFVVLGKLEYARWRAWPQEEQRAIELFLIEWWTDNARTQSHFDKEVFFEIFKLTKNINLLLDRWTIDVAEKSFLKYVDFMHDHYPDLVNGKHEFNQLDAASRNRLLTWIRLYADRLAEGFFYYENRDKELAERISIAQYIFDHITNA